MKILFGFSFLLTMINFQSCAPNIHIVDRQTLMEEEAAGDWPDMESLLSKNRPLSMPEAIPPEKMKKKTLQSEVLRSEIKE